MIDATVYFLQRCIDKKNNINRTDEQEGHNRNSSLSQNRNRLFQRRD